jgi:hypothetical protein
MDVVGKVRTPSPAGVRERQTCIGLIFGGYITQWKEALIVMSVDYTLR